MPDYRRHRIKGRCYFFTINLLERYNNHLLIENIDVLRNVVGQVKAKYPFYIDGWVILPEHMHCVWTLPEGDADYSLRIRLIKTLFSKHLPKNESISEVRKRRGYRGIWQQRFWEHTICDDRDYANHMDYLHFNPVKHGYVNRVVDWPYSTFNYLVRQGVYPADWGVGDVDILAGEPGD